MSEVRPISRLLMLLFVLATLLGLVASWLALREHLALKAGMELGSSVCHISAEVNCNAVLSSAFSEIWGIPLASIGIAFYLIVFALGSVATLGGVPVVAGVAVILVLSVCACCVSLLLFSISAFAIKVVCPLCLLTYLANGLLLATTITAAVRNSPLSTALLTGTRELICAPLLPLRMGLSGQERFRALAGLIALAVIAIGALALPEQTLRRTYARKFPVQRTLTALDVWLAAPQQATNIALEGSSRDYILGSPAAPITIVEFADFECPACRAFFPQMEALLKDYQDRVRFVLKSYPLSSQCNPGMPRDLHPRSCVATTLARCAGEQGKYYETVHFLFTTAALEHQGSQTELEEQFKEYGQSVGLDLQSIAECQTAPRTTAKLRADIAEADALGLESTPSIWIDGRPVAPASVDRIRPILDHLLRDQSRALTP